MEDARAENPNLVAFLEERLPQLGLDGETYGGYVLGTTTGDDEDEDDEELQNVIQLLQASSEDYGEDEAVWEQLTKDIQSKLKLDQDLKAQKELEQREHNKALLEQQLAQAKLEQQQEQQKKETSNKSSGGGGGGSVVDEATKRALLNRFAYDDDDDDEGGGNLGTKGGHSSKKDDGEPEVLTNKQLAAQANLERDKEMRSQKVQTKKEEQQKTKEQRVNKQQLKEERRKKATKGERKR